MPIIHIINNLEIGGAEKQLIKLIRNDKERNHIVFNLIGNNLFEEIFNKNNLIEIKFSFKSRNPLTLFKNFIKFYKLIYFYKPKILIFWLYHSFLFSIPIIFFLKNIKIYWNIRQIIPNFKFEKKSTKFIFYFCKLFSKYPHGLIFNSLESLEMHKKNNFTNNNTIYIPNGFQINKTVSDFKDKDFESKIHNKKVISLIARYHPSKGHLLFIKSASNLLKKNNKLLFLIIGKNVNKQKEILSLLQKINNKDNYCIYDETNNVDYYLQKTDILVNCSNSSEGFPNIIGEAISNDCLCISSGIGEAKRILNYNNFFLFEYNQKYLENKILNILNTNNNELYKFKSDLKKDFFEKFSITKMIDRYNKIY